MASSWAPRSSACVPGACIDETLQRRGCPQRVRNADDPLLCLLQQAEAQTEAYEQGVDALLSSLLHERDSRRKQAHLEAELLADFQTQQTQLAGATRHVEKQLRRLEARASAMSAVVCHLEDEQKHLEEAKQIVEGILQLRTLKDQLAAALSEGQLLAATAAACRVQEIRAFFNQVDEKYATAAGLLSATPAARKSPALPPRLSTVEAAALQQLQEMQTRLLDLLFRTLSSACTSAARERREAREARQRGGADAESEKKKETGGATAPAGSGGGSTGSQGVPTSSGRDGELLNPQQTQKREWRRELTDVFTSLRALQLHQDALKRFVDQLRSQLADNAARRFKVLLQLQKQTAKFQASGDTRGASHPPDLHSAALQQLGADVADVLRHQVKALELAAGTPPACGRGNWNASSPGEAAAAGLFSIVALRQEIDIQSVRILNHFSELNKEILSMKAGDKQIATSLRRVDCVLSEIISLSAQCMRMHRRLKIAASRRGSSLLLQTESLPEGTAQDGDESLHAKSASGKNAGATLVEFVRQCSACSDLTFQRSLLMKGREELMAHYVSLENAFIIGSIDQALNVVDEVPLQSAWEVEQSRGSVSGFLGGSGDAQYAPWLGSSSEPEKEDEDDERLYSTVVDDVFFILNNSVLRAIGSLDVLAVCAVVNNVCSVLSSEVKMKLRKNLEESKTYYANYIRQESHALCYSLAESLRDVFERQEGPPPDSLSSSYSWPHSVNNVSLAVTTLKKFKDRVARDFTETFVPVSSGKRTERRRREREKKCAEAAEGEEEGETVNARVGDRQAAHGGRARDSSNSEDEETDADSDDDEFREEQEKAGDAPVPPNVQTRPDQGEPMESKKSQGGASNNLMMFQYTLQAVDGVVEELQALHERCCRVTLKFLQPHLLSGLDSLHDAVFDIHEDSTYDVSGAGQGNTSEGARIGLLDSEGTVDDRLQERWRLQLQRGLAIIFAHIGREYDRPTQNLCCSLFLQVLATKMESLLLDKSYTALGGLQLSAQLRRFVQQVSALQHASGSASSPSGVHGSVVSRNPVASPFSVGNREPREFSSSVFQQGVSAFGALAAAAARGATAGGGDGAFLEEEGEGALAKVRIFCDSPTRPKFGRVLELSELLSLGSLDELLDIWGPSSGKFWRLSVEEMKKVLERRVDFTKDEIEAFFHMHQGK
ncbi:hypothetical protein TGGT1_212150 [Toxoplasma gondii GT1]|uniref:COG4 transport protein middle alpha-helical bundle domain-containing protein n=2 Tax=Toxoplasma gondii TaxID=5811 RepID=S7W4K6_TOXGG|nr:hypothetical protein TGGT1_212150 [Toxoplasma gondii GT1]KAF4640364.1 hypothetical protein TGRH88_042900 [Toxoplasma gondii]